METNEKTDNELIAEFMGMVHVQEGSSVKLYRYGKRNWQVYPVGTLSQYQTSWDWLMPAVGKIKVLHNESKEGFKVRPALFDTGIMVSIELVYARVVEFIKWYNENKK